MKILLVEDDWDDVLLISAYLKKLISPAKDILCARSLQEALNVLKTDGETLDAVLLDLNLPDADTLQNLSPIIKNPLKIPVIVITHLDDDHTGMETIQMGAQDYLVKGRIDKHTLQKSLAYAIERDRQRKEIEKLNQLLEEMVNLDPLTGLYNRRGLQDILDHKLALLKRQSEDLFVLLVDLDNFKEINDYSGHAIGDIVIIETAKLLKETCRQSDYLARIGGDEFMVLVSGIRESEVLQFAERLRLAVSRNLISAKRKKIKVTASIAVARVLPERPSIDELLEETHFALKQCKQHGKNRVGYFPSGFKNRAYSQNEVSLLAQGQLLTTVKQPIHRLSDQQTVGYEILSRSQIKGLENPDFFFRASAEANIQALVDHQCLKNCIASSSGIPEEQTCHINIFPSTLADIPLQNLIAELSSLGNPSHYCLEISEKQIIGEPKSLQRIMTALRTEGVRVAVDHVGFGKSSLESLILLHPDFIKIDKEIIKNIAHSPEQQELLKKTLQIAKALGIKTIAEGVENQEDLTIVCHAGVECGQGFYWGQPS